MGKNAIVGQSGGPTAVINASLAGVFQACDRRGAVSYTHLTKKKAAQICAAFGRGKPVTPAD